MNDLISLLRQVWAKAGSIATHQSILEWNTKTRITQTITRIS
ncbi:hypothetical protein [Rhodohalobacter sp. SW132]|nr:hypothetical protein [Rhodohalobacter sp. SW132]